MPSAETSAPGRLDWLRSQGLGLLCGFGTVLLLAVGSVVLAATRDGASASVGFDDLRGFFAPPSWVHLWFYLLIPLVGLYGLNTLLATWDSVARKWRAGVRTAGPYAASVIHVGFLVAMFGHALGGFTSEDLPPTIVTENWAEVPGFGEARLLTLEVDAMPNGMPKSARATLAVRGPDGQTRQEIVDYNQPLSRGFGGHLALLAEVGQIHIAGLGPRPAILLRPRTTPSNPWALVSAVFVGAGVLMMWRRLVPRRAAEAAVPGAEDTQWSPSL
jgi:hypothetical protein